MDTHKKGDINFDQIILLLLFSLLLVIAIMIIRKMLTETVGIG